MKNIKRAIHIDFHTMPGVFDIYENFDAVKFAKTLKEAHVEYVNIFAKCNEGYTYYPTKIGVMYPGLKRDMFGELLNECHKNNIGVSAYLNVGYDQEMAIRHRDWMIYNHKLLKSDDEIVSKYFRDMCYYNSGFRKFTIDIIKEIQENYDVDGFFLDCMSLNACSGKECVDACIKRGLDPTKEEDLLKSAGLSRIDFCKEVKEVIGSDKHVFFNSVPYHDIEGTNTHIEIEGLPGGQGYDYFQAQASYARNIEKKVLYMTGRFQKSWADFGGFKTKASLEYDVFDAMMNATEISIGDHMHPSTGLEKTVYDTVGEIYENVMRYEPWTDGAKYKAQIAILTQTENGIIDSSGRGAVRILGELKHTYDVVNEKMDFSKYELLILPDNIIITPLLKEKLKKHIAGGKGIISSGESGLNPEKNEFAMDEWGVIFKGYDEFHNSYFKMNDESDIIMKNMRWSTYVPKIKMSVRENGESYAKYHPPYFDKHWDGIRGYWYIPPTNSDGTCAVSKSECVFHICFNIFDAYYKNAMPAHKQLIKRCIDEFLPHTLIKSNDLPQTARATITELDKTIQLHIKVTYPEVRGEAVVIDEHNKLPQGAVVYIKGEYSEAIIAPCKEKVETVIANGYTKVILPQIEGYVMIVFNK